MVIRSIEDDNQNNNEIKGKIVRNPRLARRIMEYIDQQPTNTIRIIDCKPDKSDVSHQRSVFVFEDNERFQEVFSKILEENKTKREVRDLSDSEKKINDLTKQVEELKKMLQEKE